MHPENCYFDVAPRVVPAGRKSTITIAPRYSHCAFQDGAVYEVRHFPAEEVSRRGIWKPKPPLTVRAAGGRLSVALGFHGEQEHVLLVETVSQGERRLAGDFRVYSARDDLIKRIPYKGDFHVHSCRSDGREEPAYVAGASRRIGLDFMAVTDHRRYEPSLEAQRAYDGVEIDLLIVPGEEVHPPDNPVHIINFGGRFSINALFRDEAAYRRGVRAVRRGLPRPPEGVDPYQYASCLWCFDAIREGGGLGVFCHPYWFTDHRYAPSGALTSHLFDTMPFDAFEVIGGFHRHEADSNTLQVARYHEERSKGRQIPIVGASDAHGCERGELFGWYYTIVFSPSLEWSDLRDSVKNLYSVAVEALPGETPRAYGPFRFVKYALFLMREVFPQHDKLCAEEGELMLNHIAGDRGAASRLAQLKGRTAALLNTAIAS